MRALHRLLSAAAEWSRPGARRVRRRRSRAVGAAWLAEPADTRARSGHEGPRRSGRDTSCSAASTDRCRTARDRVRSPAPQPPTSAVYSPRSSTGPAPGDRCHQARALLARTPARIGPRRDGTRSSCRQRSALPQQQSLHHAIRLQQLIRSEASGRTRPGEKTSLK